MTHGDITIEIKSDTLSEAISVRDFLVTFSQVLDAVARAVGVSRARCGGPAGPAGPRTGGACPASTSFESRVRAASREPRYPGAELHGHLPAPLSGRGVPLPPAPHSEVAAPRAQGVKGVDEATEACRGSLPGALSDPPAVPSPHWALGSAPWQGRETVGQSRARSLTSGTWVRAQDGPACPDASQGMTRGH